MTITKKRLKRWAWIAVELLSIWGALIAFNLIGWSLGFIKLEHIEPLATGFTCGYFVAKYT